MSRLVDYQTIQQANTSIPSPALAINRAGITPEKSTTDNYLERVAKYIPGEIVALYLAYIGIIATVPPDDELRLPVAWGAFGICLVLTALYFFLIRGDNPAWYYNSIVSSLAFVAWAYALGGVFELMGWHKPWLASIVLLSFTAISGIIIPTVKVNQ